jgi:hypothetical protein
VILNVVCKISYAIDVVCIPLGSLKIIRRENFVNTFGIN